MRFIERLADIVDDCIKYNIGNWNKDGESFCISNRNKLEKIINPYSISTLIRQFNLYQFKLNYLPNTIIFSHNLFKKTNYREIIDIPRKKNKKRKYEIKDNVSLDSLDSIDSSLFDISVFDIFPLESNNSDSDSIQIEPDIIKPDIYNNNVETHSLSGSRLDSPIINDLEMTELFNDLIC